MDMKALREAIESRERLTQMMTDRGFAPPPDPIHAAARAVLDSEQIWWCATHKAMDVGLHVTEGICTVAARWGNPELSRRDCRLVRVRLLAEEGT